MGRDNVNHQLDQCGALLAGHIFGAPSTRAGAPNLLMWYSAESADLYLP